MQSRLFLKIDYVFVPFKKGLMTLMYAHRNTYRYIYTYARISICTVSVGAGACIGRGERVQYMY